MSSIQQQQLNRFFEILNESKLISELDEQLDITSSENYAAINLGTSDAKKVKVGLLRGFKGSWNASTNTPSLADGTGLELDVYLVSTSGSSDFGSGTITFKTDDLVFYNGTKWQKIPVGNEDASNITIDDSSLIVVKETNLQSYAEGVDQALLKDRGTEVLGGTGQVSFTIGTTVFDVAATTGQIKDDTGYYSINFLGETGISLISTVVSSIYVYIDNEGEVGQQTTEPTLIEYREKLFLTRLALVGGVLQAQEEIANPGGQYTNLLRDYLSYLSSPKKGLGLSANANLTFQVASGSVFELGINNSTQADDPNEQTFTLQNPTTFFYLNRDTTLGVGQTSLNVTSYDLNGVETTLTNNRFKIMTVYKFNSGNHVVQNGQAQYSSLDEAQTAISNRVFVINPVNNNGTRLGWIIVQKNATDLTNTSTARFVNDEGSSATSTTTTGALLASNNLSDLVDLATSRTNLDVYSTTELDNLLGDKANLSGGNDFTGNQQIKDNADNSIFHKFESFWNTSKNNSTATVSFDVNRYRWFDTLNGLEAFRIQSDTQKLVSSYDISALQNLDVTGTGSFLGDVGIGENNAVNGDLSLTLHAGKRLVSDGVSTIHQKVAFIGGSSWGQTKIITTSPSNGDGVWKLQTSKTNVLIDAYTVDENQYNTWTNGGTFGGDLQVGNQSKLSIFLDRVLTVGSSTAGKQGGIEIVGNSTVDTVVSALTFNNTQSLSSDKRIAQITSSRDGGNSIGRLDMTIWTGQDTVATPLSIRTYGVDVTGNLNVTGDISLSDSSIINLGDSDDLKIFHDGTNARIDNETGDLYIRNFANDKDVRIQSDDGSGSLADYFFADGSTGEAKMYYYGVQRLSTSSLGIEVSGNLDVTGTTNLGDNLLVNGAIHIKGNTDESVDFLTIEDLDPTSGSQRPHVLFKGNGVQLGKIRTLDNTGMEFLTGTGDDIRYTISPTGYNTWINGGEFGGTVEITNTVQNARVLNLVQTVSSISSDSYTLDVDSSSHVSNMTAAGAFRVKVSSGDAYKINGDGYNTWANGGTFSGNLDVTGTGSFGDNLIVDKTQTLATDFLTPLIIKRSGGTGVGTDMITGLAFQDFNSIQAGIYANRTQANLNYGSNLEFYTNTSSGIINPQTALVKAYTIDSNQYNTWINGGEFGGVITLATASNRGELQFGSFNTDYQIFGGDNWGYLRYNAPIHRFDIANSQILRIESTGADVTGNLDVTGTATATKVTVKGASASDGVLEIQSNNGNTAADKWSFVIDNATKDLFIKSNLTQVASISDSSGNLNMLGSVTAPDFLGNWNSLATTDFVRATGSVTQTITGAKTFSAKTIFSDQIQQGTSTSSNTRAMAFGFNTISSGLSSVSFGDQTTASGDASLALGSFNIASGLSSFAVGYFNYARAKYETALGMFGTDYTPTDTSSDRLFSVGNGSDASNRDDAFIITRKGDCTLNGDFTTNGNISLENGSGNFISSDGSDGGTAVSLDMSTVDTITFKDGLYISHTTI